MLNFDVARHHGNILRGPVHIALDITNRCNMRCKHCFNLSSTLVRQELTDTEMLNVTEELAAMRPRSFCFCGGEPLLRFELVLEMARRLSRNNVLVSLVSNGWLMTRERAKALKEAGVVQVQISIDGADSFAHEKLRGKPGSWERACQAVRTLAELNFPMRPISCCPTAYNAHQIDEMIQLTVSLGATQLRVQPLMLLGRAIQHQEELLPTSSQYRDIARKLLSKKGQVPIKLEWGDPVDHIIRFSTLLYDINPYIEIRSDGSLTVSSYLPLSIGNLRRHTLGEYWEAGLPRVWQSPLVQRISTYIQSTEDFYQPDGYLPVIFYEKNLEVDLIDNDLFQMESSEVDRLLLGGAFQNKSTQSEVVQC